MKTCAHCGEQFHRSKGESPKRWDARRFCSRTCSNHGTLDARRNGWHVEDRGFDTPCWIWDGALTDGGYGKASRGGKTTTAHRYVYEMYRGPIPEGLHLDHLCEVRECVNPDHLDPVTGSENTRRSWERGRHDEKRRS